ncbi:TetR/AcrR family transcriptional regulator [Terriglobus sp.]|uniref:TetR/AcrR family transcriptional regulator n=1 Tax=Terriglobus sp. TaxID=1889013 RepID=UPI003AFF62F9
MIVMKAVQFSARRVGRPLSFNKEEVLEKAMLQFWRTGYETTSVSDLTKAMGITAPSLYAAFGDKENLFLACLRRYVYPEPKSAPERISEAASAREAAYELLVVSARWFTQRGSPAGCLVASAASTGSVDSRRVRAALRKVRLDIQTALQERAERDVRAGILPPTADPLALAAMTVAMVQGMSTLARDGASRADLLNSINALMAAWPTAETQECVDHR